MYHKSKKHSENNSLNIYHSLKPARLRGAAGYLASRGARVKAEPLRAIVDPLPNPWLLGRSSSEYVYLAAVL
jgi:hypothetical protein